MSVSSSVNVPVRRDSLSAAILQDNKSLQVGLSSLAQSGRLGEKYTTNADLGKKAPELVSGLANLAAVAKYDIASEDLTNKSAAALNAIKRIQDSLGTLAQAIAQYNPINFNTMKPAVLNQVDACLSTIASSLNSTWTGGMVFATGSDKQAQPVNSAAITTTGNLGVDGNPSANYLAVSYVSETVVVSDNNSVDATFNAGDTSFQQVIGGLWAIKNDLTRGTPPNVNSTMLQAGQTALNSYRAGVKVTYDGAVNAHALNTTAKDNIVSDMQQFNSEIMDISSMMSDIKQKLSNNNFLIMMIIRIRGDSFRAITGQ